jgi:hypothetical protein
MLLNVMIINQMQPFSFYQASNSSKVALDTLGDIYLRALVKSYIVSPRKSEAFPMFYSCSDVNSLTGAIAVSLTKAAKSAHEYPSVTSE